MAPALPEIARDLHMNNTESVMAMSIYLLATAVGPLAIGPLSEVYGRLHILHASNVWFLIFNIVCGFAPNKGTLIAARFLAGFGASAIYPLSGGVLGDIWRPEQRGKSLGIYLLIPLLGSAVGPISEFGNAYEYASIVDIYQIQSGVSWLPISHGDGSSGRRRSSKQLWW